VHERNPGASTPDEVQANQKKTEKKAAKIAGRQYTKCPKDYGIKRCSARAGQPAPLDLFSRLWPSVTRSIYSVSFWPFGPPMLVGVLSFFLFFLLKSCVGCRL
jgi:hypothetical protein